VRRERELGLCSLEKRRLRGILLRCVNSLLGRGKDDAARVFPEVATGRTRSNGHKVKYRKFHYNVRKSFFENCV